MLDANKKIYNLLKSTLTSITKCCCIKRKNKKRHYENESSKIFNDSCSQKELITFANNFLVDETKKILDNSDFNSNAPKILVISHDFSLTGAPKAALMLAKSLKNIYKCSPVILSMAKGAISKEFEEEGFNILYYNRLPILKENYLEFFNQFDLIIANSLLFEFLLKVKDLTTPVIWWSHEIFTTKKEFKKIRRIIPNLHSFWACSPLVLNVVEKITPKSKKFLMLYGLPEINLHKSNQKEENKVVFSLIGTLVERKRQDLLIEAVKKLPAELRNKAVFYIIGNESATKYPKFVYKMAEKVESIKFVKEMPFEKLLEYYAKSDVIVSTSDFDPMPIVITHGLMFKKLCLCSNTIGTASLIKDKKDGILFEAGNSNDLANKLVDIIENLKNYETIAEQGYNVYKTNFSEEIFNTNLKKQVDKAIEFKQANDFKAKEIKTRHKISIITASYNYAHFINKTIDSVLEQTYDNWELIIVDDGSTDNSIEIIEKYLSNPKIKLLRHENGLNKGLKETILLGLKNASGEYTAFLESDDYWDKNYLFEKVKYVNEHPDAKIISNDIELFGFDYEIEKKEYYINYCKNILTNETLEFIRNQMQESNLIPTFSCNMVETKLLKQLNFDTTVPAWLDWWLWRQAICYTDIHFINKKLTHWQIHSQSYNTDIDFNKESKKMHRDLIAITSRNFI